MIRNDAGLACKRLQLLLVTRGNLVTRGASRLPFSCDRSELVAAAAIEIAEEEDQKEKMKKILIHW